MKSLQDVNISPILYIIFAAIVISNYPDYAQQHQTARKQPEKSNSSFSAPVYTAMQIPASINTPVIDSYLTDEIWDYVSRDSLLFGGEPDAFGESWSNFSDNLVTWCAVWSSVTNRLYVAVEVHDDRKGSFDNNNYQIASYYPWNDESLEFFTDGNHGTEYYYPGYKDAQRWRVSGQNIRNLGDYPTEGHHLYEGNDFKTAIRYTSTTDWCCEAEFTIYDFMPSTIKTLKTGDIIGWDIWYNDSDDETYNVQGNYYERDHQVGWCYIGKAYRDAQYFGDLVLGEIINLPPAAPVLLDPVNENYLTSNKPVLTWMVPADPDNDSLHFRVEVAWDSNFNEHVEGSPFESRVNGDQFLTPVPVAPGTPWTGIALPVELADSSYWWRVMAQDVYATGPTSETWTFTIDPQKPIFENLQCLNQHFGKNWYNKRRGNVVKIQVRYDEKNAKSALLNADFFANPMVLTGITGGLDQLLTFNINIDDVSDGSYVLTAAIEDKAGNIATDTIHVNLDSTPPAGTKAISPDTCNSIVFQVSWDGANDGTGVGLSGEYDVFYKEDDGKWQIWKSKVSEKSDNFIGAFNHTYSFEALAWDKLGNREDSTGSPESITKVISIGSQDSIAPVIDFIHCLNPHYSKNWYNRKKESNVTIEIQYDEEHAKSALIDAGSLRDPEMQQNIPSGNDQRIRFVIDISSAADGLYILTPRIFDESGNSTMDTIQIKLDATPPRRTVADSQDTSTIKMFTVKWDGGDDGAGSGLSGIFDVFVKQGDQWSTWKRQFRGNSDNYNGEFGSIYSFEAVAWDNLGNREDSTGMPETTTKVIFTEIDNVAPFAPIDLRANDTNPSPWQQDNVFKITWYNPNEQSGISRSHYKLDDAPRNNKDTTATGPAFPPLRLNATREFGQMLYLWLEDGSGNIDYRNNSSVKLRYDKTPPIVKINFPESMSILQNSVDIYATIFDVIPEKYLLEYKMDWQDQWRYLIQNSLIDSIHNALLLSWDNPLDSGQVDLKLTAWDKVGLSATDSVTFILDNANKSLPTAIILSPDDKMYLHDWISLRGYAMDEDFLKYTISIKGQYVDTLLTENSEPRENQELFAFDTKSFPDGNYTITLVVFNERDYCNKDQININIDNTPPIVKITSPDFDTLSCYVSIQGIAEDNSIERMTLKYAAIGESDTSKFILIDTTFTYWNTMNLNGYYTLYLTVEDCGGLKAIDSRTYYLNNPQVDPRISSLRKHDEASLHIYPNSYPASVICMEKLSVDLFDFSQYNFESTPLIFDIHSNIDENIFTKPAKLKIDISHIDFENNELSIFQYDQKGWTLSGGSIDEDSTIITTMIGTLGIYGVFRRTGQFQTGEDDLNLSCQPRVISPRNSGKYTDTTISFHLNSQADVKIKIFNTSGRLVRSLVDGKMMNAGNNVETWDGKDNEDRFCPSGLYIIVLRTNNKVENKTVMIMNN